MRLLIIVVAWSGLTWFTYWATCKADKKVPPPNEVLSYIGFCAFFFWFVIPTIGISLLDRQVTKLVGKRREAAKLKSKVKVEYCASSEQHLRSGRDNGLYDSTQEERAEILP